MDHFMLFFDSETIVQIWVPNATPIAAGKLCGMCGPMFVSTHAWLALGSQDHPLHIQIPLTDYKGVMTQYRCGYLE